jgi:hypothetical protein
LKGFIDFSVLSPFCSFSNATLKQDFSLTAGAFAAALLDQSPADVAW